MRLGAVEREIHAGPDQADNRAGQHIGTHPPELGQQYGAGSRRGLAIRRQAQHQPGSDAAAHAGAMQAGGKAGQKSTGETQLGERVHDGVLTRLMGKTVVNPTIGPIKVWHK